MVLKFFVLPLVDYNPLCTYSCTSDHVYMSCEVDYHGLQAPVVAFSLEGGANIPENSITNATVSGHMEYNISFTPTDNHKGRVLCATTRFTSFPPGDRVATNAPSYEYQEMCYIPGGWYIVTGLSVFLYLRTINLCASSLS